MLDAIIICLIVVPFLTVLWLICLLLLKIVMEKYGIDFSCLFNRKVVDIPDFVNTHRNSEIEYLFNERRKNDN